MQNIRVGRYQHPVEWVGWIEPDDRSWIAFIDRDGRPRFFLRRDPVDGRVLPDPPPGD